MNLQLTDLQSNAFYDISKCELCSAYKGPLRVWNKVPCSNKVSVHCGCLAQPSQGTLKLNCSLDIKVYDQGLGSQFGIKVWDAKRIGSFCATKRIS